MSVKNLLASLHAPAEATAKEAHGKAKVVESEDFSPLSSAITKVKAVEAKEDEKKTKAKGKTKSKTKAKAKDDEETEAA